MRLRLWAHIACLVSIENFVWNKIEFYISQNGNGRQCVAHTYICRCCGEHRTFTLPLCSAAAATTTRHLLNMQMCSNYGVQIKKKLITKKKTKCKSMYWLECVTAHATHWTNIGICRLIWLDSKHHSICHRFSENEILFTVSFFARHDYFEWAPITGTFWPSCVCVCVCGEQTSRYVIASDQQTWDLIRISRLWKCSPRSVVLIQFG